MHLLIIVDLFEVKIYIINLIFIHIMQTLLKYFRICAWFLVPGPL